MDRFEMWRNKVKLVLLVGTILCHGVTASPPQKEEVGEIGATNLEPSSQKLWDLDPFGSDNGSNDVVYSDYILTPAFPSFSNDDEELPRNVEQTDDASERRKRFLNFYVGIGFRKKYRRYGRRNFYYGR